jgi:hypothetical protein
VESQRVKFTESKHGIVVAKAGVEEMVNDYYHVCKTLVKMSSSREWLYNIVPTVNSTVLYT